MLSDVVEMVAVINGLAHQLFIPGQALSRLKQIALGITLNEELGHLEVFLDREADFLVGHALVCGGVAPDDLIMGYTPAI